MLARADLRERPDARPGPPRREPAEAIDGPSGPTPPYDRENDILLGPMIRNELRITVRSGELIVGLLTRSTHGPETWSWILTGVERPDARLHLARRGRDPNGSVQRDRGVVGGWTWWAGLEAIAPLRDDLRELALISRKQRLARLIGKAKQNAIRFVEYLTDDGAVVFEPAWLEGIVSKRIDAPYRGGPSKTWLKSKNTASEAVRREREEDWR